MKSLSSQYFVMFRLPIILLVASFAAVSCNGNASQTPAPAVAEPAQSHWAQDRVAALQAVYNFTPEGRRFLGAHDLRQMTGRPGWFGSFGYGRWTGVGEARPGPIMHEMSHAYWGAFDVSGRPDLSWTEPGSGSSSGAMSLFHRDLATFMAQPPDPYEPLRERLRNLPRASPGDRSALTHFGEADLVHTTGGNALLLPPILRKYFDQFLSPGPFDSWYAALEWYQGLSPGDARAAGAYFGLEHMDLSLYRDLEPAEKTALPQGTSEILAGEERQRLVDFARQFDVVTGVERVDGELITLDLLFLRGYFRDKLALYKRYPHTLTDLGEELPIAADLNRIMAAFADLDGRPLEEQADLMVRRLAEPLFSNFWPLVDNGLLMELHSRGVTPQDTEAEERTTDQAIEQLGRIAARADAIIEQARQDVSRGARDLEAFLAEGLGDDDGGAGLVVELLLAADRETAKAMGRNLDDGLIRRLLDEAPGMARQLLEPEDLLPILGVTPEAGVDDMARGIQELTQATSGNFRIDRPYLSLVYEMVAQRSEQRPREALDIMLRSGLFLEEMLQLYPAETVAILSSNPAQAASLVSGATSYGRTPQGLAHAMIYVDPLLAARLVSLLEPRHPSVVQETLVHFAYDSHRKARLPSLRVSPEKDGLFVLALADLRGDPWVAERIGRGIAVYGGYATDGTAPPDFLQEYRGTLEEAAGLMDDPESGARLRELTERAFSLAGAG